MERQRRKKRKKDLYIFCVSIYLLFHIFFHTLSDFSNLLFLHNILSII